MLHLARSPITQTQSSSISQREKQIAKVKKLRDRGLTNDEIAELLEIPLELIIGANLEELD